MVFPLIKSHWQDCLKNQWRRNTLLLPLTSSATGKHRRTRLRSASYPASCKGNGLCHSAAWCSGMACCSPADLLKQCWPETQPEHCPAVFPPCCLQTIRYVRLGAPPWRWSEGPLITAFLCIELYRGNSTSSLFLLSLQANTKQGVERRQGIMTRAERGYYISITNRRSISKSLAQW